MAARKTTLAGNQTQQGSKAPAPLPYGPDFPGFERQPSAVPPFTIGDLRRAIPAHCFERSLVRSFGHLAWDITIMGLAYYASTFIDSSPLPFFIRWALWALYWWFQGTVGFGLWVLAHECGHGAFSDYQNLNDVVGLVVHSALLVPYFSWKHSHRRHHANTNNLQKDEVHVPSIRSAVNEVLDEWIWQSAIVRFLWILNILLIGYPSYLIANAGSRLYPEKKWVNHFDPWSPIFSDKERVDIMISDVGLVVIFWILGLGGKAYGWEWLIKSYVIPYLGVNMWLVIVTFLQHTHPSLPHYAEPEWDWLRGAMCTVDRDYGWLINTLQHNIQDTHVAHHLFAQIPHYHAMEATNAIRPIMGKYYQRDERPLLQALWHDGAKCRYVAPDHPGSLVYWNRK